MKTAIIGAGRRKNGIGQYIARYFHQNGAKVTAVLGTTEPSAQQAALSLASCGITAAAYTGFSEMIEKERPEAAVIASPVDTHCHYLKHCIDHGVHIFCEKPFVSIDDVAGDAVACLGPVFNKADRRNLKIAMNAQWPFSLPFYERLCGPVAPGENPDFFIQLAPSVSGKDMILDSVPHALSMLYKVFGSGDVAGLRIREHKKTKVMEITFDYVHSGGACDSKIELVHTLTQPRDFAYGFNNQIVHRIIDVKTYDIYFKYQDQTIDITDPLELSVQDFLSSVVKKRPPAMGEQMIINNMALLARIEQNYSTAEFIEE
ncbi:MAG: Gfo/Idh/MocA family oxidoreductase [Desulfobacteraceae bacterium]|nr:Gfo/Idh/MocA family oxidoreductase [Desulfobacteraceae bacterium]